MSKGIGRKWFRGISPGYGICSGIAMWTVLSRGCDNQIIVVFICNRCHCQTNFEGMVLRVAGACVWFLLSARICMRWQGTGICAVVMVWGRESVVDRRMSWSLCRRDGL